jgi:hypothetical protein
MTGPHLPDSLERHLQAYGFALVERSSGGPMGSARLLFADGTLDILVFNDRGEKGIGLGVHGGTMYEIQVWSRVLGIRVPVPVEFDGQLAWIVDHMADVRNAAEHDVGIIERLREINWTSVKERLGLSPDADEADPRTWRRS